MSPARAGLRRSILILLAVAASVLLIASVPSIRTPILQAAGGLLIVNDPLEPVDVAVMTETSEAGELELSDLFHDHVMPSVMILTAAPTPADLELVRRGVRREDVRVSRLIQLGIPPDAIMTIDAGEGGTTEGTEALAAWVADHQTRVLVVVSPDHTRRYRRALRRMWPANVPPPRVRYPRANRFHAEDWWKSRRTLRDGLFELQKLAWDVLRHPW